MPKIPFINVGMLGLAFALGALTMFLYKDLGTQVESSQEVAATPVPQAEPQREVFANKEEPPPERAKVVRVFDALTIGLDTGHVVRYLGVRTPSVGKPVQCFGKEALAANEGMVGKEIRLETDKALERAQDGAWTRYVWVKEGKDQPHESLPSVVTQGPGGEFIDESPSPSPTGTALPSPTPNRKAGSQDEADEEAEEPKEYLVNERIMELGLGFPLLSEEMTHYEKILAAARFSSATGRGLWKKCEVKPDEKQLLQTQEVSECVIKGAKLVSGKKVYRLPECGGYAETTVLQSAGDKWFCSEDEAKAAGFERAGDCS